LERFPLLLLLLAIPLFIFFNPSLQQLNSALVMGNAGLPLRLAFE
jgi:hypothetical protein